MRNVSPSSRRARKTNSIWRTFIRSVTSARGRRTSGGAGSDSSSPLAGPAGEGGTPARGSTVSTVVAAVISLPLCAERFDRRSVVDEYVSASRPAGLVSVGQGRFAAPGDYDAAEREEESHARGP